MLGWSLNWYLVTTRHLLLWHHHDWFSVLIFGTRVHLLRHNHYHLHLSIRHSHHLLLRYALEIRISSYLRLSRLTLNLNGLSNRWHHLLLRNDLRFNIRHGRFFCFINFNFNVNWFTKSLICGIAVETKLDTDTIRSVGIWNSKLEP